MDVRKDTRKKEDLSSKMNTVKSCSFKDLELRKVNKIAWYKNF